MSLKSKLEAVIYAAEEPVTLAQLAALFTADALEWKAKQEEASAAESAEAETAEPLPLLAEGFAYLELGESAVLDVTELSPESAAAPAPECDAEDGGTPGECLEFKNSGTEQTAGSEQIQGEILEKHISGAEAQADSIELEPGMNPRPALGAGFSAACEPGPATPSEAEGDLRREARQRDREVRAVLLKLLEELIASYALDDRGIEIREIAGGYRMATKPECHDAVRVFVRSLKPPLKLSLPALETLAVIAYKQPVTAPEVNEIRGVESGATLGSLLSRKLIATAGRKPVIGRPILYKTTRDFLLRFGLKDLSELPSMEEFEKMAAIELDEQESAAEDGSASELSPEGNLEFGEEPNDEPAAPSMKAEPTHIEVTPSAPSSTEQAETEAPPNDR